MILMLPALLHIPDLQREIIHSGPKSVHQKTARFQRKKGADLVRKGETGIAKNRRKMCGLDHQDLQFRPAHLMVTVVVSRTGPGISVLARVPRSRGPAPGVTAIGAAGSSCRIEIPETWSGVTLAGFSGAGSFGSFGPFGPFGIQELRQFVHLRMSRSPTPWMVYVSPVREGCQGTSRPT